MSVDRPRISYIDLQQTPEDGRRYELYDGEAFVVPAPLPRHQRVVRELCEHLYRYAKSHGGEVLISPIDIVFSEFDVLQPDIVFFQASRRHVVRPDEPIRVPPDLAIEVLSPSTVATDRGRKMQMFARYGVAEYWIVDPWACRVEIYLPAGNEFMRARIASPPDVVQSLTLAGLEIPTAELFEN